MTKHLFRLVCYDGQVDSYVIYITTASSHEEALSKARKRTLSIVLIMIGPQVHRNYNTDRITYIDHNIIHDLSPYCFQTCYYKNGECHFNQT